MIREVSTRVSDSLAHDWRPFEPLITSRVSGWFNGGLNLYHRWMVQLTISVAAWSTAWVLAHVDSSASRGWRILGLVSAVVFTTHVHVLYVGALSNADRRMALLVLRNSFDFWLIAVAYVILVGCTAALMLHSFTTLEATVTTFVQMLGAWCLLPVMVMTSDVSPFFPFQLRRNFMAILFVLLFLMEGYYWLFRDDVHTDIVLCISFLGRERCQSVAGIRRTANSQLIIFLGKFWWKAYRSPEDSVLLRASVKWHARGGEPAAATANPDADSDA